MNRRDFMKGILAACMAPAVVRAESLMHINPRYSRGGIWLQDTPGALWYSCELDLSKVPQEPVFWVEVDGITGFDTPPLIIGSVKRIGIGDATKHTFTELGGDLTVHFKENGA